MEGQEETVKEHTVHPEVEKILAYLIPVRKVADNLVTCEEGVRVGDLIDAKTDIRFDDQTGKPMMMHSGILAIWDGIGAELLEPKLEKTAPGEYQVVQGVRFADGTVFYSTGEASQRNTDDRELSGKFPVNQAHIRAINKAMIRGLGLYRVLLTEEESDDFKINQLALLQQQNEQNFRQNQKYAEVLKKKQEKEQRLFLLIDGLIELVSLPEEDKKYPNQYITEIKEDVAYLEELKMGESKIIGFVANQFLKKQEAERKEKEKAEKAESEAALLNDSEEPPMSASEPTYSDIPEEEGASHETELEGSGEIDASESKEDDPLENPEEANLSVAAHDKGWVEEGEKELLAVPENEPPISENEETEEDAEIKYLETFFGDITAHIEMEEQQKQQSETSDAIGQPNETEESKSGSEDN